VIEFDDCAVVEEEVALVGEVGSLQRDILGENAHLLRFVGTHLELENEVEQKKAQFKDGLFAVDALIISLLLQDSLYLLRGSQYLDPKYPHLYPSCILSYFFSRSS
jgi:hypothetical protein